MLRTVLLIGLAAILGGCAVSRVSSIKAPIHGTYSKIMIYAAYGDIEERGNYEMAMYYAFRGQGINCFRSIDCFPPLRDYSDSEQKAYMNNAGIDAFLNLKPQGSNTVAKTTYNSLTGSYDTRNSLDAVYVEATIMDTKTEKSVYRASVSTSLGELTDMRTARQSAATEICDDLTEAGFLKQTLKPQ